MNDGAVQVLTIDPASDLPIFSLEFIRLHPSLNMADIRPVPNASLDLRNAGDSPTKVVCFIRFDPTFMGKTLLVEAFVLRDLFPDCTLTDHSIMSKAEGILDKEAETLSSRNSKLASKLHTGDGTSKIMQHAWDMRHVQCQSRNCGATYPSVCKAKGDELRVDFTWTTVLHSTNVCFVSHGKCLTWNIHRVEEQNEDAALVTNGIWVFVASHWDQRPSRLFVS